MLRPCIETNCPTLTPRTRCVAHERQADQARQAKRGDRYGPEHRRAAKDAITAEPWCHWPGCGRTDDLTADHTLAGYQVLCRSHNSAKANMARAGRN